MKRAPDTRGIIAYARAMTQADIIIIGAGIAGLSTAYEIMRRRPRASVQILEAGPRAGEGASWANGSMVHPSQATPWAEAHCANADRIARQSYIMAARSSQILKQNMDAFGIEARHRKSGCAKLYQTRAAMDADMEKLLNLADIGLRVEVMSPAQMAARLPIGDSEIPIAGGACFPDDHSGPPRLYCAALIEKLREGGVDIRVNTSVEAVTPGRVVLKGGSVIKAQTIILCAGAGNAAFKNYLKITGVRGYSRTFDLPAGLLPDMAIMDDTAHISVTPLGDHLRVSGGADIDADAGVYQRLEDYACALLPGLAGRLKDAPKTDWTALRPMSDCGPVIGRVADGIYANTGHGHMGWTLSAGAAQAVADAVLSG